MNKIYKVMWSKVKNCYVVVSEMTGIAKNRGRGVRASKPALGAVFAAFMLTVAPVGVHAAPATNPAGEGPGVAIGTGSSSNQASSVAVGNTAVTTGAQALAVGYQNTAGSMNAVAVGTSNNASQGNAVAIGVKNTASGSSSVALGQSNTTSGVSSVAVGNSNQTKAQNDYAFGAGNIITGTTSYALGNANKIGSNNAYAIGENNVNTGLRATTVGNSNKAGGQDGFAAGYNNVIGSTSKNAVTIGNGARVGATSGSGTVDSTTGLVTGTYNGEVDATGGVAVGNAANVMAKNGMALGVSSSATVDDGVALGSNAVANRAAATTDSKNIGYDFGTGKASTINNGIWKSNKGAVSVGNGAGVTRQITSVAAGTNDTDAVNVAQLKGISNGYFHVNTTNTGVAAVGNNLGTLTATAGAGGMYSVAAGVNAKVQQAADNGVAVGYNTNAQAANTVAIGSGASAAATGVSGVSLGAASSVTKEGGVALGSGSVADRAAGYSVYDPLSKRVITDEASIAAAMGKTAQLNTTNDNIATAQDNYDKAKATYESTNAAADKTAMDKALAALNAAKTAKAALLSPYQSVSGAVSVGKSGVTRQIINVAAGSADTDAVNVAQLKAAQAHFYGVNSTDSTKGNYNGNGAKGENALAAGVEAAANTKNSIAIGNKAQVLGNGGNATGTSSIAIGDNALITTNGLDLTSIAMGKNAKVLNGSGKQEKALSFMPDNYASGDLPINADKSAGGIAIGTNSFARTASIQIGSHTFDGYTMGGTVIDNTSQANIVGMTTIGTNTYNKGALANMYGAYSVISGDFTGAGGFNSYFYGSQNFGANVVGSLNSIRSAGKSTSSGIANSIVGLANITENANGALIYGAGNKISNSVRSIDGVDTLTSLLTVDDMSDVLRQGIQNSDGGGATLAIGGGNTADYTQASQMIGVNNTLKGASGSVSKFNMLDGFKNTATNVNHVTIIGSQNTVENGTSDVLIGDNHTVTGTNANNIILGSADTDAAKAAINGVSETVSIGHNSIASANKAIAIGTGNKVTAEGSGAIGDPNTVSGTGSYVLGNDNTVATDNTFVLGNKVKTTVDNSVFLGDSSAYVESDNTTTKGVDKTYTSGTVAGNTVNFAGGDKVVGVVSVGSASQTRRIQNVAPGLISATSTDAINGSQLNAVAAGLSDSVEAAKTHYYSVNDMDAALKNLGNYDNDGAQGIASIVSGLGSSVKVGNQFQGATASVFGTLNTVDASTGGTFDGVANSIVGVANTTKNANAALIFGAGNLITNSYGDVNLDTSALDTSTPEGLTASLAAAVKDSGGDVLVIGGANAVDNGQFSQVTGIGNKLTGKTTASQYNSITGSKNEATDVQHVTVMGSENNVTNTTGALVLGDKRALTGADGSIVLGSSASGLTTSVKNAVAIGTDANVATEGGVALGANSVAAINKEVAGYDPLTGTVSTNTGETWKSTAAAVSVGDAANQITRQITNVAAGTADSDAVNVAQLKAVKTAVDTAVEGSKIHFFSAKGSSSEANYNNDGATGDRALAVGAGAKAEGLKAIALTGGTAKGDFSFAVGNGANANGWGAVAIGAGTLAEQQGTVALGHGAKAYSLESVALGYNTQAGAPAGQPGAGNEAQTAMGSGTIATGGAATAFGFESVASGAHAIAGGDQAKASGQDSVALGKGTEASGTWSVALGNDTKATNNWSTAMGVETTASGESSTAMGVATLASGVASTAMGSATQATGAGSTAMGGSTIAAGKLSLASGAKSQANGDYSTAMGFSSQANAKNSAAVSGGIVEETAENSVAMGKDAKAIVADTVALGSGSVASTEKGKVGYDVFGVDHSNDTDGVWKSTANAISVGDAANQITRQITGVAAGTEDTDAVNVAQLKALEKKTNEAASASQKHTSVTAGKNISVQAGVNAQGGANYEISLNKNIDLGTDGSIKAGNTIINQDGVMTNTVNATTVKAGDTTINTNGMTITGGPTITKTTVDMNNQQIHNVAAGTSANDVATVGQVDQKITDGVANASVTGGTIGADGTVSLTKGDQSAVTLDGKLKDVSAKAGEYSIANGTVTIGMQDNYSGAAAGNIVIKDVAKASDLATEVGDRKAADTAITDTIGATSTTALKESYKNTNYIQNSGTLAAADKALDSQIKTNADNITNLGNTINNMGNQVGELGDRVNKVGAGAAALAALHPLDFDPDDKWDVAAGYGNYKDAHAVAVGAFYRPNEDTMFSVGGSFGNGNNMVNAGVSVKLGQGNHVSTSKVAMAKEIVDLRDENKDLKKRLDTMEQKMNAILGLLDTTKTADFPDVPKNHWAYEYVSKLAGNGILEGYPDGDFSGDRTMTRYEMAAVFYRALKNGAPVDSDMDRAMNEFEPELRQIRLDRIRVDRVSGKDNERNKVERVRVNNENDQQNKIYRDVYGTRISH